MVDENVEEEELARVRTKGLELEGEMNEFRDEILGLDPDFKNELDYLHKNLYELSRDEKKIEGNLRYRVAAFCLALMERAPNNVETIRKVSYVISGFNNYKFDDELDYATDLAKQLEEEPGEIEGSIYEKWNKMEDIFGRYIG